MTPPADDLYAFLGLPATAVPEAVQEAIARTEKRLSGKHGLTLTELSKRRALLLQAKRWLVPADRKEEYDRARASGAKAVASKAAVAKEPVAKPSAQPRAGAKPVPAAESVRTKPAAAPASPPPAPSVDADETEEGEGTASGPSLPLLIAALGAGVVLAFAITFGLLWAFSGSEPSGASASNADEATPADPIATVDAPPEPAESSATDAEPSAFIRADVNDQIVLSATNAKLIGPTIRLDAASNPPRIENWTSSDSVEWEFESPSAAIYQATLEYGMKPESEGNRFKITSGAASVGRTVGGGAFADGIFRDVFFLKIEKKGRTTLKIEPLDVVGGELMQFRNLTLAPRQKTAAPK